MKINALRVLLTNTMTLGAARIVHVLSTFICLMMAGQSGRMDLAAASLAVSTMLAVFTFITTIFYATGILIRYHISRHSPAFLVGALVNNSFIVAWLLALPIFFLVHSMDKILVLMGQDPALAALTADYFHFAGLSIFPTLLIMILGQFYVGTGRMHMPLLVEMLSFPLTVFAAYCFINGHFSCHAWGLGGVSLSVLLVQCTLGMLLILYTLFNKEHRAYRLFRNLWKPEREVCRSVLKLGLPIGIQFGGELSAMAVCGYFVGYFGVDALAALQIVNQYSVFFIMISLGLSHSVSLMSSEQYGEKGLHALTLQKNCMTACLILLGYSLIAALLFTLFPAKLYQFYTGTYPADPRLSYLLESYFILSALFIFMDGLRNVLSGALRGLQDTRYSMWINLSCLWLVSIPCCALSAFELQGGPVILRAVFLSGFVIAVILLAGRFYFFTRRCHSEYGGMPCQADV